MYVTDGWPESMISVEAEEVGPERSSKIMDRCL